MKKLTLLAASIFSASVFAAASQNKTFEWNGEVEAGVEYDSNVTVDELDSNANQGDMATTLEAGISGTWRPTDAFKLRGGYSYSRRDYQDTEAFNLALHKYFADASYNFGPFTLGANHHMADAALDGADFLELEQSSIYASRLFSGRNFLRVAATQKDKRFDQESDRNAKSDGYDVDFYRFSKSAKSFVSIGISSEDEKAIASEYSHQSDTLRLRASHKFPIAGKDSQFQIGYRYNTRDYVGANPLIGARREDTRSVVDAEWEVKLNKHLSLAAHAEFGDYQSNLAAANYDDTVVGIKLKAGF